MATSKDLQDKIEVRKGTTVISVGREDFGDLVETAEGVVFQLKNGFFFTYEDPHYLTTPLKRKIKSAIDTFLKGTLIINLDDYRTITKVVFE